jgi:SAM-dependent methyltransferase
MIILNNLIKLITTNSTKDVCRLIVSRLIRQHIDNYGYMKNLFKDKSGIEIGGPSGVFRNYGFVPLYNVVRSLDGCNFSTTTIWEGVINEDTPYLCDILPGLQYISEATDLSFSPNDKYDFVISSNCLEHVANPLKAIEEWIRVIKKDGLLLLNLPNKDYCFDHKRHITDIKHLHEDYKNNIDDFDLSHLNEILELHDLMMDKCAGNIDQFKERSLKNQQNRALHHHVFDIALLKKIFYHFKIEILVTYEGRRGHIILGRKIA